MSMNITKPIIRKIKDNETALAEFEKEIKTNEAEDTKDIIMNFPTVYIHNWPETNKYDVYVGESNNIFARTRQHYHNRIKHETWQHRMLQKDASLYIIGHEHFNKSLTLDVENLWGHRNILSKCHAGDFFGEPYAASLGAVLNISVAADEDCEIIFLNVQRLLVTCQTACEHHQKLIRNLVSVLANKILILNDKITHVGKRTTRDKLLSYLSAESIRHSSLSFDIPFDRQQLADYLCIDRAAMSTEISKLQKEGFIKTNRNHFELIACNETDLQADK